MAETGCIGKPCLIGCVLVGFEEVTTGSIFTCIAFASANERMDYLLGYTQIWTYLFLQQLCNINAII